LSLKLTEERELALRSLVLRSCLTTGSEGKLC